MEVERLKPPLNEKWKKAKWSRLKSRGIFVLYGQNWCIRRTIPNILPYLYTGDLGHITENGVLFITGRIKRIIMTKGKDGIATKMFPDRIEKAVLEHPAIGLCCVIGVADEARIHYAKAVVVLNDGYSASEDMTQEIIASCKNKLPEYMVPEMVEYRHDLPRTERGKVDYRALEKETGEIWT